MMMVQLCTVSGNSAENGSGLVVSKGTIESSTITNNTALGIGGGIAYSIEANTGSTRLKNNIVAKNNSPSQPDLGSHYDDLFESEGFNLIGLDPDSLLTSLETTDQVGAEAPGIDPIIGTLSDNGGDTETHALLTGSPAINAGSEVLIGGGTLDSDQRGEARPFGISSDIGAYESDINGFFEEESWKIY